MQLKFLALFPSLAAVLTAAPAAAVVVRNPIDLERRSQTIVLDAAQLRTRLTVDDVRKIHVRAEGSSQDLIVQAIDLNDDEIFDQLLFQADFAPRQTRTFLLTVGEKQTGRAEDYRTYGRFVRERREDFAWENDRIAHRMYGKELESWPHGPLTSSAVDVWTKRVRSLVINNWYMVDDYHKDHGEGADFYSSGNTRGDGGTAIWADGKVYPSANFRGSKVLAVGPIRVLFELTYESWNAAGVQVSEKKRISLDAGQNLSRFESSYAFDGNAANLSHAVGIRKLETTQMHAVRGSGILRTWEVMKEGGELGQAVILDPADPGSQGEDDLNFYAISRIRPGTPCVSYAGFAWTISGDFKTAAEWDRYLASFAAGLRAPLEVKVEKR